MKIIMCRCFHFIFSLLIVAMVAGAVEELPLEGETAQNEVKLLRALTERYPVTWRNDPNTGQKRLVDVTVIRDLKVDGEKIVRLDKNEVDIFRKYFFGIVTAMDDDLSMEYSSDGENWRRPGLWWTNPNGQKGYYRCSAYLRFRGNGTVKFLLLRAINPVSLDFDAEPYLIPGANKPVKIVKIKLEPSVELAFDGQSKFNPRQWLRVYNMPDSIMNPDYRKASEYFVPLGFAGARDAGFKLTKSPAKEFVANTSLQDALRGFYPDPLLSVVCYSAIPKELQCQDQSLPNARTCPASDKFREVAELIARSLKQREQSLGEYAGFRCEVKNEPDIGTNWGYFNKREKYDAWKLLADYHNEVADAVHKEAPRWKVGGPSSCQPILDNGAETMLTFIDRTCEQLDFYSWHFYEHSTFRLQPEKSFLFGRLDASIDLYRSHLRNKGGEKPLLITEYGGCATGSDDIGVWTHLRSASALMVQMLAYPDLIEVAVPFVVPVSWWSKNGRPGRDCYQLFNYDFKTKKMELTPVAGFLQLWRNLQGTRIPAGSNCAEVRTAAIRDGNHIYLAVSNLSGQRLQLELDSGSDTAIRSITQRRLYIKRAKIVSGTESVSAADAIPVAFDETTILDIELDAPQGFSSRRNRTLATAGAINQPSGTPQKFQIRLDKPLPDHSILRLGVWRNGGFPQGGRVTVKGHEFAVSGTPKSTGSIFTLLKVELPEGVLKEQNEIEVLLRDKGGLISSVTLENSQTSPLPPPLGTAQN